MISTTVKVFFISNHKTDLTNFSLIGVDIPERIVKYNIHGYKNWISKPISFFYS